MPLLFALLGICLPAADQDAITLARVFREGDREVYVTKMQVAVPIGDIDITLKVRQSVKKALANGGAEIESELLELKTAVNGQAVSGAEMPKVRTAKYVVDRSGLPTEVADSESAGFNFLLYMGLLTGRPIKLGESAEVAWSDPAKSGRMLSGSLKLEFADDKIARLASKLTVLNDPKGKPLTIDAVSILDRSTGKLEKASGSILGLPGNLEAQAIQFSTERQK